MVVAVVAAVIMMTVMMKAIPDMTGEKIGVEAFTDSQTPLTPTNRFPFMNMMMMITTILIMTMV